LIVKNPILPGFHPDPSACQVGEDYYIAVSTFEWWPGICIYHSKNLAEWNLVSRPVTMTFFGVESSGGLWAPHLSWSDEKFWLAITDVRTRTAFKDTINYITCCETIDGKWSEPVYVNSSGFDPALFHDDDGRKYFMNMIWDHRPGHPVFGGIVMQEFDPLTMKLTGGREIIFEVTDLGVAEGPQILKKDGWYYLLTAAGGTGYKHAAVVARSKSVWGPYAVSPYHPLLTSAPYPGNPLQKIEWADGWPRLSGGGNAPFPEVEVPGPDGIIQKDINNKHTDFNEKELPCWFQTLRGPLGDAASLTERPGWLRLYAMMYKVFTCRKIPLYIWR
jgi:xylan 1,4-beta-xylosidase